MALKGWRPFFFSSLSSLKCLKVSALSFLLFFLLSFYLLFPPSSNVILGDATHIRNRMRESLVSLHQQTETSQVGSSSSPENGEDAEDDDDSVLTEGEQDAEDECEAQEVMQQMIKDELEGRGSSLMASSPQWQLLKQNLERSADNQEMCAAARSGTSSSSPMCRQIHTSDKDKDKKSGSTGASSATGNDLKCGGRDYEVLVEKYINRNNCLASVVSSHTLAQPWLGHTDPSKASSSSSSSPGGVEGSAKSEAVARRGIIDVLVEEYKKAMDSKVLDDQLWYIYQEASNILEDFRKGAVAGLNAFNSEEIRKVWVKRRTQQVAILCGLGNGKAAELGTSVIVNDGNLIFRVNLDGADDDAVTAYVHAIGTFAHEFVRRLLEKGGLVDRAIELHKKFHKFRFFKIQGLLQNSEPSTDVREQNKLMNALPLQKHKKKKGAKKDGKEGAASDSSSSSQQSPSAFLQIQQTTQEGVQDLPPVNTPAGAMPIVAGGASPLLVAAPPSPTAAVTPGVPISSGPMAGVLSSPGVPVVTQGPIALAPAASGAQGTPPSQGAQPVFIPTNTPNNGSASGGFSSSSSGDQSSSSNSNPQLQQQTFVPLALPPSGQAQVPPASSQVVQVVPPAGGDVIVGGSDRNPAGQEGGGENKMMAADPFVLQPPSSQQQPPLSPLEEYEKRGSSMPSAGVPLVVAPNDGGRPPNRPFPHDGGEEASSQGHGPFGDEGRGDDQQQQRPHHLDVLDRDSHAELPWKKNEEEHSGGKGMNGGADGGEHSHDDQEGGKAVPIKTKITAIMSRLRMLNMKNDTVQYEANKELVDSIVRAAYLDMSDRVLDVWASLLPQAAVTTTAQLLTILLPKPDVDFAEFYNKTLNADGTITDGVTGQLPVNHTRLVERFAKYVEEIYRDCWRVFFASNDNFLAPPPQPRHPDFSSSGASSYSAGLPSSAGGVSTLEVQQQEKEEKRGGLEHNRPSSSSLASVNEHSFVSSHASASVESESSSSSSFPSVALVASSDGAPINDLTELVTDPEVVEKTAAKAFTAGSVFASPSSGVMLLCTVVAMTVGGVWNFSFSS
ncbi:gpi-anchored micronemal antigen [Cystoisospora suis]|uniref:Gpi-anchored micronemal antigen n=1 Tax=Cystoisospora suis TaxID=483139 RepID=A0A2C6KZJ6_9APIC|nr:gpi-anchored micronemal antigen [Cystoisospora suis]